eukprot:GEZU01020176.1.p1 GENE.GEZU01020176.1~~GEZU01020176.1.p1  ORF type:complete len:222 (+),score=67.31 GEZU01020176.1:44-709(+)
MRAIVSIVLFILLSLFAFGSASARIILTEGQIFPQLMQLQEGEYNYFIYSGGDSAFGVESNVVISVMPFNGVVDVYVATGSNQEPTADHYEWAYNSGGAPAQITIEGAAHANYYIGVHGKSAANFTLVAFTTRQTTYVPPCECPPNNTKCDEEDKGPFGGNEFLQNLDEQMKQFEALGPVVVCVFLAVAVMIALLVKHFVDTRPVGAPGVAGAPNQTYNRM